MTMMEKQNNRNRGCCHQIWLINDLTLLDLGQNLPIIKVLIKFVLPFLLAIKLKGCS